MPSSPTRRETSDPVPFDRLLLALDPDRDRAGERYEQLRRKLIRLFGWRGCLDAERCADETLDRVARRLAEGADVPDVAGYCHGVALNVLREHWRQPERQAASLDGLPATHTPAVDPVVTARQGEERHRAETRLRCLDRCLRGLAPQARSMLTRYHAQGADAARQRRLQLAEELGVPLNALRIRVHRVRASLARCIGDCVAETKGAAGP
jgi:DNA-directed RNA polymerase specialized sigma24 family protein